MTHFWFAMLAVYRPTPACAGVTYF